MTQKGIFQAAFLAGWLVITSLASSTLTSWHTIPLPLPAGAGPWEQNAYGKWRVTHYLSTECACSQSLADYLVKRGPLPQAIEEITVIESSHTAEAIRELDSLEQRLRSSNPAGRTYRVRAVTSEQAALHGIEAVPLLEITSPENRVAYRGGHRRHGEGPGNYSDLKILSSLMNSRVASPLPVFGCATSQRLRSLSDPLGIKLLVR